MPPVLRDYFLLKSSIKRSLYYLNLRWASGKYMATDDSEACAETCSRGLVLGVYADECNKKDTGILTPVAWKFNKVVTCGRLMELLRYAGPMPKRGELRIFYDLHSHYSAVAVVGLGRECMGYDSYEVMDEGKEAIRNGVAVGCRALQDICVEKIVVENFGHTESAAEGAAMAIWAYQELKNKHNILTMPTLDLYVEKGCDCDWEGWQIGLHKAAAQNLARELQETPANLLTPTYFAQNVVEVLCKSGVNVEVKVKGWAESQQMNAFLAISRASCEPPIFLELSYYGACHDERPIVLVGQGVTYDAGGLNLKGKRELEIMRGDMSGAACVVAVCRAVATLKLPVNIRGLIPLCENTVGCNSCRPGDVVKAMNSKSVEIEDVSREDALVLIDALLYAQNFWPKFIVDIGTTSKETIQTFHEAATGVYTNSEILWQQMRNASMHTGDRVWRMPLWNYFQREVTHSKAVDVQNVGIGKGGRACRSAALLREFVPCGEWMHIDARNVMTTDGKDFKYLREGMAGRPTRTLVEFICQQVCIGGKAKT